MKMIPGILVVLGLIALVIAAIGRIIGNPHLVMGLTVVGVLLVANTLFTMAILAKLFEKK